MLARLRASRSPFYPCHMKMKPSPGWRRRLPALGLSLLGLAALYGCYDREHRTPEGPQGYHVVPQSELPVLTPREAVVQDVSRLILEYHFGESQAAAHPERYAKGRWSGNYTGNNGRKYTIFYPRTAQRAELNRLRDSLLATGPADFKDTLMVLKGPTSSSIPGDTLPDSHQPF